MFLISAQHADTLWRVMYFLTAAARLGANLPNVNSPGCKNDKYCNGLFSGCTATADGATCTPKKNKCGPYYVDGWAGRLCTPGFKPGGGDYDGDLPGGGNEGATQPPPLPPGGGSGDGSGDGSGGGSGSRDGSKDGGNSFSHTTVTLLLTVILIHVLLNPLGN